MARNERDIPTEIQRVRQLQRKNNDVSCLLAYNAVQEIIDNDSPFIIAATKGQRSSCREPRTERRESNYSFIHRAGT